MENYLETPWEEQRESIWFNAVALVISVAAAVTAFLPIALNTSPWDAVRLKVPGNQGNWWHALIGAPYFLGFPMAWVCLRSLFPGRLSTPFGRRLMDRRCAFDFRDAIGDNAILVAPRKPRPYE